MMEWPISASNGRVKNGPNLLRLDVFRNKGAARLVRVARAHGTANAKIKCRTWIRVSPVDA